MRLIGAEAARLTPLEEAVADPEVGCSAFERRRVILLPTLRRLVVWYGWLSSCLRFACRRSVGGESEGSDLISDLTSVLTTVVSIGGYAETMRRVSPRGRG